VSIKILPPPAYEVTDEPFSFAAEHEANFEIEVSDFRFVTVKNGRALRFTVTWKFLHPKYGLLGESEEGWLCSRDGRGELRVAPPISRFGPQQSKQLKTITVGYHDLILAMIANYKTKKGTGYGDYIGRAIPEAFLAKDAQDVDPELPQEISA
jgi:hypothetical protein